MLKKLLVVGSSFGLLVGAAQGGAVIIDNFTGPYPVTLAGTDTLVPGGTVQVGSIALADADVTNMANSGDIAGLVAAFTRFGVGGDDVIFNGNGSDGFYTANVGGNENNAAPLTGAQIDIFTGNGDSLATSTQVFIYRSDQVFEVDNPNWSATVQLDSELMQNGGTVLAGIANPDVFVPLANARFDGVEMVPIPEPTSGLFVGLGALAFLVRRRRR